MYVIWYDCIIIYWEREREWKKGKERNTRSVLLGGWFFKPKIFTRLDSSPTEIHTRIFGTVEKILLCFPRNLFPSFLLFCAHSKAWGVFLVCFVLKSGYFYFALFGFITCFLCFLWRGCVCRAWDVPRNGVWYGILECRTVGKLV